MGSFVRDAQCGVRGDFGCQTGAVLAEGKGSRGVCRAFFWLCSPITATSPLLAATRPSDHSWLRYFYRIYAVITMALSESQQGSNTHTHLKEIPGSEELQGLGKF